MRKHWWLGRTTLAEDKPDEIFLYKTKGKWRDWPDGDWPPLRVTVAIDEPKRKQAQGGQRDA